MLSGVRETFLENATLYAEQKSRLCAFYGFLAASASFFQALEQGTTTLYQKIVIALGAKDLSTNPNCRKTCDSIYQFWTDIIHATASLSNPSVFLPDLKDLDRALSNLTTALYADERYTQKQPYLLRLQRIAQDLLNYRKEATIELEKLTMSMNLIKEYPASMVFSSLLSVERDCLHPPNLTDSIKQLEALGSRLCGQENQTDCSKREFQFRDIPGFGNLPKMLKDGTSELISESVFRIDYGYTLLAISTNRMEKNIRTQKQEFEEIKKSVPSLQVLALLSIPSNQISKLRIPTS